MLLTVFGELEREPAGDVGACRPCDAFDPTGDPVGTACLPASPDAHVRYLSHDTGVKRVDEMLNLGKLKATDGAFYYELTAGIHIASVRSVVVWCRQFGVLFAEAPLTPEA
jgi:hypothetical protein